MKKRFFCYLGICIFTFCLNALNAEAFVLSKSFDDLVQEADLIVEGTVGKKESVWAEDHTTIYTFVTLSEIEVIDGTYENTTFTLRMDGGEVMEAGLMKGLKTFDTPEFEVGERVVLFIQDNTWEVCPLVGWSQGKIRVTKDPETGEEKLQGSESEQEIAGINEEGFFLYKPMPRRPQDLSVTIEEADPKAKELRLKYEAAREYERQKILAKKFTLQDLKNTVKSKAKKLKDDGKKHMKLSKSANMMSDLKGRKAGTANER